MLLFFPGNLAFMKTHTHVLESVISSIVLAKNNPARPQIRRAAIREILKKNFSRFISLARKFNLEETKRIGIQFYYSAYYARSLDIILTKSADLHTNRCMQYLLQYHRVRTFLIVVIQPALNELVRDPRLEVHAIADLLREKVQQEVFGPVMLSVRAEPRALASIAA